VGGVDGVGGDGYDYAFEEGGGWEPEQDQEEEEEGEEETKEEDDTEYFIAKCQVLWG
jgi:hypothetical protein